MPDRVHLFWIRSKQPAPIESNTARSTDKSTHESAGNAPGCDAETRPDSLRQFRLWSYSATWHEASPRSTKALPEDAVRPSAESPPAPAARRRSSTAAHEESPGSAAEIPVSCPVKDPPYTPGNTLRKMCSIAAIPPAPDTDSPNAPAPANPAAPPGKPPAA